MRTFSQEDENEEFKVEVEVLSPFGKKKKKAQSIYSSEGKSLSANEEVDKFTKEKIKASSMSQNVKGMNKEKIHSSKSSNVGEKTISDLFNLT